MRFQPPQHRCHLVCIILALSCIVGFAAAASPTIVVTSSPSGADVYIEGAYKGTTPLDLTGQYAVGSYSIEIRKVGYVSWLGSLNVKASGTTSISATLAPYKGSVEVTSVPDGATIYLDGNYAGISPKTISDIPTGVHAITLKKDGYNDWDSEIDIIKGKTVSINARMETRDIPYDGSINIQSTPSNAEVYIDGEFKGYTPLVVRELGPNNYHISLKLTGYYDWDVSVDVGVDEQEKISANLYPAQDTSPTATTTPVPLIPLVTAMGIVGLFVGTTYKKE